MRRYGIRIVLLIALLVRLYHLTFPVAGFQAWRQADTAAVARNFYEGGFHLLYPQIDWGGTTSGYVEMEFPIYSFVVALLYKIFFPSDMWGRLLSVVCSLFTIYGLYLLTKKTLGDSVALWAAGIYAILPLNIFYTRAFMPESAMLMCSAWGIYHFSEWLDTRRMANWFLSLLFISLAALLKIPALYLGLPLFFLGWSVFQKRLFLQWRIWLFVAVVFAAVGLWYYHSYQLYKSTGLTFGIWFFGENKWGMMGPLGTLKWYNDILFKSIAERHLTYAGFIPFVIGLFIRRTSVRERLFDWWLIALVVYFFIVTTGNQIHEYYQLPFVLPAVVYIAKAFDKYLVLPAIGKHWRQRKVLTTVIVLCLCGIPILSFLRVDNFMKGERLDGSLFQLAGSVQSATKRDDLVIAVDNGDPVVLYRVDRKGWHGIACGLTTAFVDDKAKMGARYVVGQKELFTSEGCGNVLDSLMRKYPVVSNTDSYFILKTSSGSNETED